MATKSGQDVASTEQIEELLDAVDSTLDRLKTLYEQYFLGIQKQAPAFIHSDVERKLRDLTQLNIRNTGLRYRLATLQQKFGSYNSYWRRTLRQIENGTYTRNLAKIGREAARNGSEIPEEILAAMPKRMREQVLRDRDQALAIAKRRQQDAGPLPDDEPAQIADAPPRRDAKTVSGAHVLSDADADIDFNELFSAFDDDAPKEIVRNRPVTLPPQQGRPPTRPPMPRMPVPATSPQGTGPLPVARAQQPSPAQGVPQPVGPQPSGSQGVPRPMSQQPTGSQGIPRSISQQPTQPTGPVPVPIAQQPTQPTGPIPRPQTGSNPTVQTGPIPRPQTGPNPTTGPIPRPQTGPNPTAIPRPQTGPNAIPPTGPIPRPPPGAMPTIPRPAPSQQSRPIPVIPGSAAQTGPVPVESMSGPFPRTPPSEKPAPATARPTPKSAAAPLKPPPGMTDADVNALHAKYVKAKEAIGEKVDAGSREKLLKTINQTAPKIMEQYKASGVDFSVVVKDNQVVIKAKPKT